MVLHRAYIEKKILDILIYIGETPLAFPLKQNMNLFSLKELEQLLAFLESGKFEYIYDFLDEKYKEYLSIIQRIKIKNINKIIQIKKEEEKNERNNEQKELEGLMNF